jgi:integration host factor subunit alpha
LEASPRPSAKLEEICEALVQEESVKLRSFGNFHLRSKRERVGRNPKTGAKASICARKVVTFKASPILVARVNTAPTGDLQL